MHRYQVSVGVVAAVAAVAVVWLACAELSGAVITVQIGGATRLGSLAGSRQRADRYSCFWDCGLVGCQIAHDDDECDYECEKVCRLRLDYAGRSAAADQLDKLAAKSGAAAAAAAAATPNQLDDKEAELLRAGTSVRLHLPRNASARNFAIWERCSPDAQTGRLTENPFHL